MVHVAQQPSGVGDHGAVGPPQVADLVRPRKDFVWDVLGEIPLGEVVRELHAARDGADHSPGEDDDAGDHGRGDGGEAQGHVPEQGHGHGLDAPGGDVHAEDGVQLSVRGPDGRVGAQERPPLVFVEILLHRRGGKVPGRLLHEGGGVVVDVAEVGFFLLVGVDDEDDGPVGAAPERVDELDVRAVGLDAAKGLGDPGVGLALLVLGGQKPGVLFGRDAHGAQGGIVADPGPDAFDLLLPGGVV